MSIDLPASSFGATVVTESFLVGGTVQARNEEGLVVARNASNCIGVVCCANKILVASPWICYSNVSKRGLAT